MYCWDLVGLRSHRELPDHGAGALVEGGDQVRRCRGLRPCTTYGLAVQGDHATRCDSVGAGPHERAAELVEEFGVEAGEHPADGRLGRAGNAGDPEDLEDPIGRWVTRPTRHTGHAAVNPQVRALDADVAGTLARYPAESGRNNPKRRPVTSCRCRSLLVATRS